MRSIGVPERWAPQRKADMERSPMTSPYAALHQASPTKVEEPELLFEREGTAEITNDPRFFTENVIDKRLMAFEALAIITELLAEVASKECFELSREFKFVGDQWFVGAAQMLGTLLMIITCVLDLLACGVLSLQLFFTIRLMTAGPTGFDKAARFYADKRMWLWRERAISGIKWSMALLLLSSGLVMFSYLAVYGSTQEHEAVEHHKVEYEIHKIFAFVVLVLCLLSAGLLAFLVKEHQHVFDVAYASIDSCHPSDLHGKLITYRRHPFGAF